MKTNVIVFVDVDETEQSCYSYREPHFAAARRRGLFCLTIARKNRSSLTRLYNDSDQVILLESLDEQSILASLSTLHSTYRIKALFCYAGQATRFGQIGVIVANICKSLGLTYSSAMSIGLCNDKFSMREALKEKGIASTAFALCHNQSQLIEQAEKIGYPLIAKPRFGARSAFIKKCHTLRELIEHYDIYRADFDQVLSRDSFGSFERPTGDGNFPGATILLESWIDGIEGSVECVIANGSVHPLIINEKLILTDRKNTILENLLITPPESFSSAQQQRIREYARLCIEAVGLDNAIAHFEFKMTSNGPIVIEINPRLGGLYVSSAFTDIAELDPWETYLDLLLNDNSIAERLAQAWSRVNRCTDRYAMIALYPDSPGRYREVTDTGTLQNKMEILQFEQLKDGAMVTSETEEHYLLKCWAKVKDTASARSLYREVSDLISPVID
ncbi:ATP-grasp domain-containing protein [Pseudomonas japonica]|uniref:ATP-grasp domain-containing protein n=1 Tax=Pseudomonas japonica TaxID=256466 RepID=A0A239I1Z2_9PSED|nr:ATP-grasp domain-containing protein [Pseudomonas japonica]SNS87876.1 ATP-grasp domain-containing protein [Pseudomonas japonica]